MASYYADFSATGGPHGGTSADPWTASEWLSHVEGGGEAAGSIFRQYGTYSGADVDIYIANDNQTLDGWGGPVAGGYDVWRVPGPFDYIGGGNNGTNLKTRRGAFGDITGSVKTNIDGRRYTWECCYFYDASLLLFGCYKVGSLYFNGCTFNAPVLDFSYQGGLTKNYVNDCIINGSILLGYDAVGYCTVVFTRCYFVGKTQAEVLENVRFPSKVTFVDCVFEVALDAELPTSVSSIREGTLRYSTFFGERHSADYTGYDHGFGSNSREGPGAFYFGMGTVSGTATPSSGVGPMDTHFETSPEGDVDVQWDFGDGTYSEEWQSDHRYTAPGKYEVTLTWTDRLGNTSTTTFTIYVYDWDYSGSGVWASYTDECLRLSMHPAKGLGWSEFNGDGWPFPEARVGPLKIIDDKYKERQLVLDSLHGRVVEIGLTEGFRDLAGSAYEGGNFSTEIRFPEEIGDAEHYFMESLEHHAHFRPFDEDDGYLDGFGVDFSLLKDGAQSDTVKTEDIPLTGDVTPRLVGPGDREAHRWQPRIVTNASGYRLVRLRDYYVVRDKASGPDDRVMTEQGWEQDLADVLLHMGRNELNPVLNFATGVDFSGSYSSVVAGPDGLEGSALAFAGAGLTSADSLSLAGNFSIVAWVNQIGATQTILNQASGFRVRIVVTGTDYTLEYRDGSGTYTSPVLSWPGTEWSMCTIVRSGRTLSMYHDDTLVFSQEVTVVTNTGAVQIFPSGTGYGYDIKILDGALEAGAVAYHHKDVTEKEGVGTCPLY